MRRVVRRVDFGVAPVVLPALLALTLTASLSVIPGRAVAWAAPAPTTASAAASAAPSTFDVSVVTQQLSASKSVAERRASVQKLLALPADAAPELAASLAQLRQNAPPFLNTLKAARGASKNESVDLLEALLAMESPDAKTYDPALRSVALLRALSKMGTVPAARVVIENALAFGGALKIETARLVKAMGDPAVPALIEAKRGENKDLRAWASQELEALGKKLPGDAVQTKDYAVLADTLRAYGKTHDTDAIGVVLSFVNSDRTKVREAAREATLAFGQDAIWKLREQYTTLTGKTLPEGTGAAEVAKELFTASDRNRLEEVYALVEEGKKAAAQSHWKDATLAYDKALARQPTLEGRGEMVAAYVEYGRSLEDADPPEALALFRKALRIDPHGHRAAGVDAEIAFLEGQAYRARGLEDPEPFRRALTLDPSHERARKELDKMESYSEQRSSFGYRVLLGAGFLVVAIGVIMLFGGRAKKARAA